MYKRNFTSYDCTLRYPSFYSFQSQVSYTYIHLSIFALAVFTPGQFWPSGIVVACVCLRVCVRVSMCVCQSCVPITRDNSGHSRQTRITKFGPKIHKALVKIPIFFFFLFIYLFFFFWGGGGGGGGQLALIFKVKFNLKSEFTPFQLVRTITHYPFKLGSHNLDQMCKIAWFRSLLFWVAIDLSL